MKSITAALIIAAVLLSCDLLLQEDMHASYPDEMSHAMRTALKFLEVDVSGTDEQIMQSLQEHINTDLTVINGNNNGSLVIAGTHEEGVETYRAEVNQDEHRIVFWRLFKDPDNPKTVDYFECQEKEIDLLNDYRYMEFIYTDNTDDPDINGTFTMTLVDIWKAEEFSLNVGTEDEASYKNYVDAWIYRGEGTVYADGRVKLNNGSEHSKHVPRVWIDETWSPAEDEYEFELKDEPAEGFSFSWNLESLKEFIEAIDTKENFSSPDGYPYIAVKTPHEFTADPDDFYLLGSSDQNLLVNDGYHSYIGHAEVCDDSLILFLWGNKNDESSLPLKVYPYELKDVDSNYDEDGWWVSEFQAGDDFFDDYEISLDEVN